MDPVTTAVKTITEWVMTIADKSKKAQLEAAKAQIDLAKVQLEAVAKDRDDLTRKNGELVADNQKLSEKVAYFELSLDYDMKEGLLYKKGTAEGPYCQVDRHQMTFQGHSSEKKKWKCPKCGQEGQTIDPELADSYVGGVARLQVGPNPFGHYRG